MLQEAYNILLVVGISTGFVVYPIYYRIQYNYYKKHRSDLTRLLYGNDPFKSSKKLSWSDQFMMTVGINFCLIIAWRYHHHKKLPNQGLMGLDPNMMRNQNYLELYDNHPFLRKLLIILAVIFPLILISLGSAFLIEKFVM